MGTVGSGLGAVRYSRPRRARRRRRGHASWLGLLGTPTGIQGRLTLRRAPEPVKLRIASDVMAAVTRRRSKEIIHPCASRSRETGVRRARHYLLLLGSPRRSADDLAGWAGSPIESEGIGFEPLGGRDPAMRDAMPKAFVWIRRADAGPARIARSCHRTSDSLATSWACTTE